MMREDEWPGLPTSALDELDEAGERGSMPRRIAAMEYVYGFALQAVGFAERQFTSGETPHLEWTCATLGLVAAELPEDAIAEALLSARADARTQRLGEAVAADEYTWAATFEEIRGCIDRSVERARQVPTHLRPLARRCWLLLYRNPKMTSQQLAEALGEPCSASFRNRATEARVELGIARRRESPKR